MNGKYGLILFLSFLIMIMRASDNQYHQNQYVKEICTEIHAGKTAIADNLNTITLRSSPMTLEDFLKLSNDHVKKIEYRTIQKNVWWKKIFCCMCR